MALPNYRIEIVKRAGTEEWSNDYLTDDATMEDAQDLAQLLVTFERNIHATLTEFVSMRVSTTIKGDRTFRHFAINQTGLIVTPDYLPLYCCARMDMPTSDADPCRKYYRLPVREADQSNGRFSGTALGDFQININQFLVTPGVLSHIVSNKGNTVIGASVFALVQMRQLHRRKRKKVTGGTTL